MQKMSLRSPLFSLFYSTPLSLESSLAYIYCYWPIYIYVHMEVNFHLHLWMWNFSPSQNRTEIALKLHWNCNEVIWWVLVILWFSKAINMNIMCLYFRDLGSVNNLWKCWVKFHSSWKREWNFIEISLKFHCNLINEISLMKFQFHTRMSILNFYFSTHHTIPSGIYFIKIYNHWIIEVS